MASVAIVLAGAVGIADSSHTPKSEADPGVTPSVTAPASEAAELLPWEKPTIAAVRPSEGSTETAGPATPVHPQQPARSAPTAPQPVPVQQAPAQPVAPVAPGPIQHPEPANVGTPITVDVGAQVPVPQVNLPSVPETVKGVGGILSSVTDPVKKIVKGLTDPILK